MRIISGSAKGRKLHSPSGDDVRPTTDIVKEAVFSIIQFELDGARFLDAFAGSGQMGLEAVSRGAACAWFIDNSRRSMQIIRKNIDICGFTAEKAVTVPMDTLRFLSSTNEHFDMVFLDPPYRTGLLQNALTAATRIVSSGGCIICEHPVDETLPQQTEDFVLKRNYRYGTIIISLYRRDDPEKEC